MLGAISTRLHKPAFSATRATNTAAAAQRMSIEGGKRKQNKRQQQGAATAAATAAAAAAGDQEFLSTRLPKYVFSRKREFQSIRQGT